ncbi:hypothetical protein [Roseovarius aestuarii]|uniref:Uncharacterized protein n=1 Tax=Roseovarius aestuarii TaxID=475083 RepID=A0A1X7BTW8_9RHOB|nr:hypothetical protein [Roseovarius aestuarii]SMC13024.1 hypothetical protein ROA7745_02858 [Roseovarius aestuarii]
MTNSTNYPVACNPDLMKALQSRELESELATLRRIAPDIGLAIQMIDYNGDNYMLKNRRMTLWASGNDGHDKAEVLLSMTQGDCFETIRILALGLMAEGLSPVRTELVCAALDVTSALNRSYQPSMAA